MPRSKPSADENSESVYLIGLSFDKIDKIDKIDCQGHTA